MAIPPPCLSSSHILRPCGASIFSFLPVRPLLSMPNACYAAITRGIFYNFEALAGVYRDNSSASYIAVCTRYGEIDGLTNFPAGS